MQVRGLGRLGTRELEARGLDSKGLRLFGLGGLCV